MNNRIRIARGKTANIATTNETLATGQPFYISDKNYLIVGKADTPIEEIKPITVRELAGWYDDNTTITSYTGESYYIRPGDSTNLEINAYNQLDLKVTTPDYISTNYISLDSDGTNGDGIYFSKPVQSDITINGTTTLNSATTINSATSINNTLTTSNIVPKAYSDEVAYMIGSTTLHYWKAFIDNIENDLMVHGNLQVTNNISTSYYRTDEGFDLPLDSNGNILIPGTTDLLPASTALFATNGVAFVNRDNDNAWIRLIGDGADFEEFEIATSASGDGPIYVRQYNTNSIMHEIILLDRAGNTNLNHLNVGTIGDKENMVKNITAEDATFKGTVNAEDGIVTTTLEVHTINLITT